MTRPGSTYSRMAPGLYENLLKASALVRASKTLEPTLIDLVQLRASHLNGCGFCTEMHVEEAIQHGDTHERLHALPIWRESARFSPRERAALAWTEAVTRLAGQDLEAGYAALREHFSDEEAVELTFAICTINTWNRLNVAFGTPAEEGARYARRTRAA